MSNIDITKVNIFSNVLKIWVILVLRIKLKNNITVKIITLKLIFEERPST